MPALAQPNIVHHATLPWQEAPAFMADVVRQHRETDYAGNFLKARPQRRAPRGQADPRTTSAFDAEKQYYLTELGSQFVHYAMTELTPKIEYQETGDNENAA